MFSSLVGNEVTALNNDVLAHQYQKVEILNNVIRNSEYDLSALDMSKYLSIIISNTTNCKVRAQIDCEELERKISLLNNNIE